MRERASWQQMRERVSWWQMIEVWDGEVVAGVSLREKKKKKQGHTTDQGPTNPNL